MVSVLETISLFLFTDCCLRAHNKCRHIRSHIVCKETKFLLIKQIFR